MRALGIDLAAGAAATGAVWVEPTEPGRWQAIELEGRADDDTLVSAAHRADVIGVDAPLGWPIAFVEAVAAHNAFRPWPGTVDRSALTHRDTDRAVRQWAKRPPLSVSADKLGSVAMRCALLQRRWAEEVWGGPAPRDGSAVLVETYPAAAFSAWGIDCQGYKSREQPKQARTVRQRIVERLEVAVQDWLDLALVRPRCVESDHILDALICSLVAVACKTGCTHLPNPAEQRAARIEGWIHVPSGLLANVRPPGR